MAYAKAEPEKGLYLIGAGADRVFDVDDPPVQLLQLMNACGGLRTFGVYDTRAIATDGFAGPFLPQPELIAKGPDGCLTRTEDNVSRDLRFDELGLARSVLESGNRAVALRITPRRDLEVVSFEGARQLWGRDLKDAGQNLQLASRYVTTANGFVYDFGGRTMRRTYDL